MAEGRGNLPSAPPRVSRCPPRLPSLPCVALRGLRQAHTKFILEACCPGLETKECFSRAFMKFVCFIKAPIVPSLRWDYPSEVVPSAWVKEMAALPCRREFGTAGPGRETGEVRGRPSTQQHSNLGFWGWDPQGAVTSTGSGRLGCKETSHASHHAQVPSPGLLLSFRGLCR